MEQAGAKNLSAYLRKMAIDGHLIQMDLSEIGQMVALLRRCSNNINQLAKAVNGGRSIYAADIADLQEQANDMWATANQTLKALANIPV